MKNEIIMMVLIAIGLTSAMYAGESMIIETNLAEPISYMIVGNHSNMDGFYITSNNSNVTVSTVEKFKPDNFTVILFGHNEDVIEVVNFGGGSRTRYVYLNESNNDTVYVVEYINVTSGDSDKTEVNIDNIDSNVDTIDKGLKVKTRTAVIVVVSLIAGLGGLVLYIRYLLSMI